MDAILSSEERDALSRLDTEAPVKPDLPSPIGDSLVEKGLVIRLVEGGLQLTTLGRDYLAQAEQQEK